ncbi:unnamed protein product [Closterium sp. NIES-54]
MAEWEMRTVVKSMRMMLLHMGMQHHGWQLALRQAVWVHNCLERSMTPPGTISYKMLTGKRPDLMLARVWGCMVKFIVPEQQRGGKLAPKNRWGLHVWVSPKSKGWEMLDLTNNMVDTSVEVIFYETMSLEVWKVKYGLASGRTEVHLLTETSTATFPLLAEVDEPADENAEEVLSSPSPLVPVAPPLVLDLLPSMKRELMQKVAAEVPPPEEQQTGKSTGELSTKEKSASGLTRGEQLVEMPLLVEQPVDDVAVDDEGELLVGEESTDSDVVEVPVEKPEPRRSGQTRKPLEWLSYHACQPPATFTTLLDDVEADDDLPQIDPDVHTDPDHRWDTATMTVKEVLASWKGKVVKAAMDKEILSLIGMGTWELVERPRIVNIMKNYNSLEST